ncbi:MAG: flagellar export protein FliJ [Synergistetes bacterium]|nr:MAG: Flagellar export protein FliJ [bacterium 42_11]MBC7331018.1 flagellar export protein FliJ [Synergistota bacterium]MDK2871591.1 flagellar protein FliJ [bacterium]
MAFNFRFERILELKRKAEDALKNELALLNLRKLELVEERETLLWELESMRMDFLERQGKGLKGEEMRVYLQFMNSLTFLINEKDREIARLEREMEGKREELLEAIKERKKFERLREKAYESYLQEELHRERVFLDEIGQNLFLRGRKIGS